MVRSRPSHSAIAFGYSLPIAALSGPIGYPGQALRATVAPMAVGSVIGVLIGGLLVGVAPAGILTFGLGVMLIVSALRVFAHARRS